MSFHCPVFPYFSLSVFLFVRLPVCLYICLSAFMYVCISVCTSVYLYFRMPVCLSVGLAACLTVRTPVCLLSPSHGQSGPRAEFRLARDTGMVGCGSSVINTVAQ